MNWINKPMSGWTAFAILILILLALGIAGSMDYRDARKEDCGMQGKFYDADKDVCFKEIVK